MPYVGRPHTLRRKTLHEKYLMPCAMGIYQKNLARQGAVH